MDTLRKWNRLLMNRFYRRTPFILSHQLTSLCNAKCRICNRWKQAENYRYDLSTEEVFTMIDNAHAAGIFHYIIWGGEPLLRKDLPEILKHAKKYHFTTEVITNGLNLKSRYSEIQPYTDHIIVSIDSPDKLHDDMRDIPGLLERAIEGIKEVKQTSTPSISIHSVISKLTLDKVEGMIKLADSLGVPISFEPMLLFPQFNENIMPSKEEFKNAFFKILDYKKSGFSILNSKKCIDILIKNKCYHCRSPYIFIEVDASGNMQSCLDDVWGNIKEISFSDLFQSERYKEFIRKARGCSKCTITCIIENSLLYSLYPSVLMERFRYI